MNNHAQMAKWLTRSAAARIFGGSIPSLRFYYFQGKNVAKRIYKAKNIWVFRKLIKIKS